MTSLSVTDMRICRGGARKERVNERPSLLLSRPSKYIASTVMAQRLKDFVRNSPLNRRRGGGYAVLESEQKDPFQHGINFHAHYIGSVESVSRHDSPEVQRIVSDAWKQSQKSRFRKVVITVKSTGLRVKDVRTKVVDDYPIYLVSYCGASSSIEELFFFIHKTKLEKVLRVEFFQLTNTSKVTALTLTVAKAFNIAYKAWMTEKRRKERETNRGSESPLPIRRQIAANGGSGGGGGGKTLHLKKMAPGITSIDGGPYTPPARRKSPQPHENTPKRSGSFGDIPREVAAKNPAMMRVQAENETTGSTHMLTLTDEFDSEFQQIAQLAPQPDLLSTNVREQPDHFNWQEVVKFTDPGSVEDLTSTD